MERGVGGWVERSLGEEKKRNKTEKGSPASREKKRQC